MAEEVKKDEAYKAKPPTVGEYYGALHVAMAAESLIGAITRKGTKHFTQGAFERLWCSKRVHELQAGSRPIAAMGLRYASGPGVFTEHGGGIVPA
jgi:hypothetical protein